jgi:hypothetical protein
MSASSTRCDRQTIITAPSSATSAGTRKASDTTETVGLASWVSANIAASRLVVTAPALMRSARPPTADRRPPTADRRPPTADRRPPASATGSRSRVLRAPDRLGR